MELRRGALAKGTVFGYLDGCLSDLPPVTLLILLLLLVLLLRNEADTVPNKSSKLNSLAGFDTLTLLLEVNREEKKT